MRNFGDEILRNYAIRLLAGPYKWAGNDPIEGFDCSGYVVELLQSCGQLKHKSDYSSQGLFDFFESKSSRLVGVPSFGTLVFYGQSVLKITHVAFALDQYRVAEYAGGGSKTQTEEDAKKHNAYGRIRPIDYRRDRVAMLKPYYATIGGALP